MSHFDNAGLESCYEEFRKHDLIVGGKIECWFGPLGAQQLKSTPCVRWEPGTERLELKNRANFAEIPRVPGGVNQLSGVHSKHVRRCSVALFLYAKDVTTTEQLLARTVLALEKIFMAEINCRFVSGAWVMSAAHSSAAERYRLDIDIALPILRIESAANAETLVITEGA